MMNMGVIRYKIWHDLWENKGRTLRVVAIIAIGAFAVGAVLGGKEFILKDLARTWQRLILPCLLFAACGGLLFWYLQA